LFNICSRDEDAHDRQPLAPLSSTPDGAASSSGGPSTRRRRTTRATASLPTPSHTSPGGDDDDDDDDRRRRRHSGAAATAHAEDLTPPAARRRRTSESAGAPTPAAADTDASPPEPAADPLRQRLNATDESAGPIYPLATHLQVVLPVAPARPEYYAEPVANLYREDIDSMEVRVWGWSAEQELEFLPTPNYLHRHPDLSPRIRLILVDWLFEVADEFGLQRETVYLAVNYVDRYLSVVKNCARDVIQLLGVTCLFLAAKLEEVRPPVVQDYARVTAGLHTCLDVRQTELLVLAKLNWKMSAPTANGWVNLYLNNAARRAQRLRGLTRDPAYGLDFGPKYSPRELANVMATVDYCIHHEDSLRFSYSMLAAAALKVHGIDDSTGVSPITGFDEAHLAECLDFVRQFVHLPRRFQPRPPSNAQVRRTSEPRQWGAQ